jgi:hypothetical protein
MKNDKATTELYEKVMQHRIAFQVSGDCDDIINIWSYDVLGISYVDNLPVLQLESKGSFTTRGKFTAEQVQNGIVIFGLEELLKAVVEETKKIYKAKTEQKQNEKTNNITDDVQ